MSTRRYTDDEIHAIFERAAARQEAADRAEEASRAELSLEELQRIGAEAGIDPAHIAAAAQSVAEVGGRLPEPAERETLLGMPTRLRETRYLDAPLTDALWEQVIPELRRIFGADGLPSSLGRTREWAVRSAKSRHDRPVKVTFTPDGAGTRVEIEHVFRSMAHGFLWGSGSQLGLGVVLGTLLTVVSGDPDGPFLAAFMIGMGLLFLIGSQIGMRLYGRHQEARFEEALDRIARIAHSTAAAPVAEEASGAEATAQVAEERAPRLDLDALPDAPHVDPRRAPGARARS